MIYFKNRQEVNAGDLPLPELKFKEDLEVLKEVTKNFNK